MSFEKPAMPAQSIRMPKVLCDWLKQQAAASLRSFNSEVVWQLQQRQQQAAAPPSEKVKP